MKVLITGGAGFIGSHLSEKLIEQGDDVICVDNLNDYYSPETKKENISACLKSKKFRLHKEDILNLPAMDRVFDEHKPEKVVHMASRVGVRPSLKEPALYADVNIKGTVHILELARKYKIRNIVFASSSSVYGGNKKIPFSEEDKTDKPISPYGASKKAAELLCHSYHSLYGTSISCLRFFTVYGERGRPDMAPYKFTKLISEGKEIEVYGNGRTKRDYTYIKDIIQGVAAALEKDLGYEVINLGNSSTIELQHLISLIEKETGKKAKIKYSPMQAGDVPETYAEISKAKRLLGFTPKTKIEAGIKKLVEWYNDKHPDTRIQ
ncbi:GDP-mannose 4,6-dehydratase [Candidatus Woesearchaeota archaeon]|nr:GDP-mannose 4,6-dehydratase [Candidatus Woesearchaeota archaeon]